MKEERRVVQDLGLGGIDEEPGDSPRSGHQHREGEDPVDHHQQRAGPHALPDALGTTRTVVLAAVGGHGDAEALKRTHEEHLDAHGCRKGRHAGRTQSIVGALQHDAADRRNGELQAHRHPDAEQLSRQTPVEAPLAGLRPENLEAAHHVAVAEPRRKSLRDDRSDAGSGHAPLQHQDAEEVEYDVEHRREEQEPEGRPAVTQSPDDAGQQVVEEGARNANEGNQQVGIGPGEDVVGSPHDPQDIAAQQARNQSNGHRHHRREFQADEDQTPHGHIVSGAELLGYGDAESAAATVAEAQDQEDDRSAGSDRGQGIDSQEAAHDHGIDQRVGLLQQVAQQQRQGEVQNQRQRTPRREFLCRSRHNIRSSITAQR